MLKNRCRTNLMERNRMYKIIGAIIGLLVAYYMFWFIRNLVSSSFQLSSNYKYLIQYIPMFLGVIGVVLFFATNFKNTALLRLFMCMEVLYFPFSVLLYIWRFQRDDDHVFSQPAFSVLHS